MRYLYHKCIAHAKCPLAIGHASVSPASRKHLDLVEFVWNKAADTSTIANISTRS